ncbi:glycosyltransferase family 39 protein [Lacihabitans sp. CS3-21]|uniref:glycosyltransferase family 39 protein n=1 Tax=Lacihabitans sp. CS3-21 TaxID=2487332 RepID=UPI0020CDEBF0|nr:glycosyltransferase family 39 protein [Lacihabitans sp. CS3-21]MCP9746379.1 phospholipid carrier-dependent glycosyltransferase [Lacihabitans sp. CS3-21]
MRKYGLLIILVVLASYFRFSKLDNRGLFTDEKFTLLNANGIWVGGGNQLDIFNKPYFTPQDFWASKNINDYFEAIAHSDFGTHIVYNGILHFWMELFGNSDYSVRFLSALFSLLTVVVVYLFSLKVFQSKTIAFLSGFLLALDPLNIAQSHIARSYTLSFLLVILATYYFIEIFRGNKKASIFIIYSALIGLALLNHYLNFLVPLSHGLVFLLAKNKKHLWFGFISAAIFNVLLMLYWFNWGGGYIAMDFLKDKNEKHLKLAQLNVNKPDAAIQLSTPNLVAKKTIELVYDSSIITQGLFIKLNSGLKNVAITYLFFVLLLGAYYFKNKQKIYVSLIVLAIGLLAINHRIMEDIVLANCFYFIVFFAIEYIFKQPKESFSQSQFILLAVSLLMFILPILFVVNDALKNGHTTSLTHRYIGVASPFVAILLGFGIYRLLKFSKMAFVLLAFVYVHQYKPVKFEIMSYFEDKSTMNAWFEPARVPNPYLHAAASILEKYEISDTLYIPGGYSEVYDQVFDNKKLVYLNDAQYLNLYLPKKSNIPEKIDVNERDKVFLKKENGEKLLIFDFEGTKYRY